MSRRIVLALLAFATVPVRAETVAETAEAIMHMSVESPTEKRIVYPAASRIEQVDDYHGVKVADPYRWLEDLDSQQTRDWVEAENKVTSAFLAGLPEREPIRKRLTELWNYERYSVPCAARAGATSSPATTACRTRASSTRRRHPGGRAAHARLDPNTLSKDGTVALTGWTSARTASCWPTASPRPAPTGRSGGCATSRPASDLPDTLKWVKFSSAAWTHDGKGFFYSRYDEPTRGAPAEGGQLLPEALLPPPRHAAGRRRAGLPAARPEGVGLQRRASPRTAATSSSTSGRGRRPRTASSTRTSRSPAPRSSSCSTTSTPTTPSSTTTARSSGSTPTTTRRAAG